MLSVYDVTTNHLMNPIGIDTNSLRFSWKIKSEKENVVQTAYQLQAAYDEHFQNIIWDTKKQESAQSIAVNWEGPELKSAQRIYWHVKVWSQSEESFYSEVQYFEMGLLEKEDWKCSWIEMEEEIDPNVYQQEPIIRKSFYVDPGLKRARIYASAHGAYTFFINGKRGTEDLFLPGRTAYYEHLPYQTYDIGPMLNKGENVLAIVMGDGWWRGSNTAQGIHNLFGEKLAFIGQIILEYEDGRKEIVTSDHSFKYISGPLLRSDTKAGEIYDASLVPSGWEYPEYDDSNWNAAIEAVYPLNNLVGLSSIPVRAVEEFQPEILYTPDGNTVLDFKQNIAGFVSFRVTAPKGTRIRMVHSEVLNSEGNFTAAHYSGHFSSMSGREEVFQEEIYVAAGNGIEYFCPLFGIFGFRYVLLEGYPGEPAPEDFTAHAVYSCMRETGTFLCSNEKLNQLVKNSMWSQKGNFLEIPTDCPTRERAAWSGDAQVYCKTASDFMDTYTFFEKWMKDVAADQTPDGKIRNVSPQGKIYNKEEAIRMAMRQGIQDYKEARQKVDAEYDQGDFLDGSAGWGDVAVILPWTIYQVYGDKQILENQYKSAKKWMEYILRNCKNKNSYYKDALWYKKNEDGTCDGDYIWDTCFHWGEWLEPDGTENDSNDDSGQNFFGMVERQLKVGEPILTTAFTANSAHILSQMADVLGKVEDAEYYYAIYDKIRKIYNRHFIKDDGSIIEGRQAPQARTLAFGLADEKKRRLVAEKLNEYVIKADYHLNTGFLSTKFLLPMLAEYGYAETAYKILMQEEYPSWLFHVDHGATTICESWGCYMPGKEPFASCNHYSYGAVCDFMFSNIAGIQVVEPGYKKFVIEPRIGGRLNWAKAEYESAYGKIVSQWERKDGKIVYKFEVPANTSAVVKLEAKYEVYRKIKERYGGVNYVEGKISLSLGSGIYEISI